MKPFRMTHPDWASRQDYHITVRLPIKLTGSPLPVVMLIRLARGVSIHPAGETLQLHLPGRAALLQPPHSSGRSSAHRKEPVTAVAPERPAGSERQPA